ncbi:RnfABCDGE type electron transport complex subunit G [bacterium]|nr:RnfABCDGE type electron transport complex subunit G [bacterium]
MKTSYKMFIVLTLIALLSGGLLSALNNVTEPRIERHRVEELKAAISEVLPAHDFYEEISQGAVTLYVGKKKEGSETVGVATRLIGSGFQGKVSIMVGIKPDFSELTGFKVLEQVETPGLGTKIVEDPSNKTNAFWFPEQFKGLQFKPEITVVKNIKPSKPTEVQAIAGATISSKAVVAILNQQLQQVQDVYQSKAR